MWAVAGAGTQPGQGGGRPQGPMCGARQWHEPVSHGQAERIGHRQPRQQCARTHTVGGDGSAPCTIGTEWQRLGYEPSVNSRSCGNPHNGWRRLGRELKSHRRP
jgi:hypothetical protein